jgi:pyruvate,water dikinase
MFMSVTMSSAGAMLAVNWEQPGDEQMFWQLDRLHFPNQLAVMEDDYIRALYAGFAVAAGEYEAPIRLIPRRFLTRHYLTVAPLPLSDEELEEIGKRFEQNLGKAMAGQGERWEQEYLPEIRGLLAAWEAFDLAGATDAELLEHWDVTMQRLGRLSLIHFQIVLPMLLSVGLFDEIYTDLFGAESSLESMRLLQGTPTSTTRMGHELWRLSRVATQSAAVRAIVEEQASADVVPALERDPACTPFLAEFRAFLSQYGHRAETWGISYPSWIEDPSPAVKSLKDFLSQQGRDLAVEAQELAAERDRLIAEARDRLAGYPAQAREQFEFLLAAATAGNYLSEEHGFWIDSYGFDCVRQVILEVGRRLASRGALEERDDIFHLTFAEARATFARPGTDRRGLIAERKAELAAFRDVEVPPVLGTEPPGPPPDNPLYRTMGKFFGAPPPPSDEPGVLRGSAGSAGSVRGVARVVRSLSDAQRLQPGEILVTETTAPAWTPLFASAAAVVTDTGGVLSHCAVVAREYMIPAVVGTGIATAIIPDGAMIEVDGSAGIVRIVAD